VLCPQEYIKPFAPLSNVLPRHRGNQYVTFKVTFPKTLTDRQKQILLEFEEEEKRKSGSDRKSVWETTIESAWKRVKDFLGQSQSAGTNKEDAAA